MLTNLLAFLVGLTAGAAGTYLACRAKLAKALRVTEEKYARIFRSIPDPASVSTVAEGRFLEVNDVFVSRFGFSRDELVGHSALDVGLWHDPADRGRVVAEIQSQGGKLRGREALMRTKSGEVRTCRLSGEVIVFDDHPCFLAILHDVTELKESQEERERFVRELEAKNAELERFTYTVSHDLKSPLVTIRGFLGYLERDVAAGDPEKARQDVDRIRNATEAMKRLLEELLELSRVGRQPSVFEEVPLAAVVDEALELVGGRIAERGVEIDVAADLPAVVADRVRLREVYQNLVDNAVKFMGDAARPRIEIGARGDGGEVACFVRDNGAGIEPRYHTRIFDLFERLDTATEGTGVGLALVKRIVEVHGGRIWVESEGAGRGSTFWWTLPAARAAGCPP